MARAAVKSLTAQKQTLCVGRGFASAAAESPFPAVVLAQTADFAFDIELNLPVALQRLQSQATLDLLLLDADSEPLPAILTFVREARRLRPKVPIVAFSERGGDAMRYLLREGTSWHFTKRAKTIAQLARALRRHVLPADLAGPRADNEQAVVTTGATAARPANPYVVGRPLTGVSAALYVGRHDIFAWFQENLAVARPNALLLYGERRIGKTSTLYQLVEGERGRTLREAPRRPIVAAYVDLQRLAGCRTDEWLRRLAREVYRQVATSDRGHAHAAGPAMPPLASNGDSAYAAVDRALDHLEQIVPGDALILVAIDELEQLRAGIDAGRLDPAVAPYLRSQVQHRPRLAFVFAGSYGLLDPFWQPLTDLAARRELGPLDEASAAALVREPVAGWLAYQDDAVAHIYQQSGGRPLRIQTLCHQLVAQRLAEERALAASPGPVGVAEVQQIIDGLARAADARAAEYSPFQPQVTP